MKGGEINYSGLSYHSLYILIILIWLRLFELFSRYTILLFFVGFME